MPDSDPPSLRQLVVECLERMEAQGSVVIDDFCREHPEQAEALRRRLGALKGAGVMDSDETFVSKGQRLGDFQLLDQLGQGGMGVVFSARQLTLDREVAVKLIRPDYLFSEQARSRFQREVELAAALQHPGIVPVYSVEEHNGLPFFAMERVHGATLAEVLAELEERSPRELQGSDLAAALDACTGGAEPARDSEPGFAGSYVECCLRLVLQAAQALEHAHARGVLHRDVKPSNLMLTPSGRVLLLDFGLASTAGLSKLTGTGSVLGSLAYMSPEQHRGEEADERSDVFGLGVTLYELLALEPPFQGPNAAALSAIVLAGQVPSLRERNPSVPLDVETACTTAMERDPERRYGSIAAFARDLRHLLAHEPIEARPLGPGLRLQRWSQRHPALTLSFFVGLGLSVLAVGALALQANNSKRDLQQANDDLGVALDQAFGAVDRMLSHLGDELVDVPRAQTLRAEVMDDALSLFEEVRVLRPLNEVRRRQWGNLYIFRADALLVVGDYGGAVDSFERGIQLFDELVQETREPDLYWVLARACGHLGRVHADNGKIESQLEAFDRSIAYYDRLIELEPDNEQAQRDRDQAAFNTLHARVAFGEVERAVELGAELLATTEARVAADPGDLELATWLAISRYNHAGNLVLADRHDEGFEHYERSLAQFGEWISDGRATPDMRFRFGECAEFYGLALALHGRLEEALIVLADGLAIVSQLLEDYPDNQEYGFRAARLHLVLGEAYLRMPDVALAREYLETAVALLDELCSRAPDSARLGNSRIDSLVNLAATLSWSGELEAAQTMLQSAIEQQATVVEAWPDNPEYERVMGLAHVELGVVHVERGDFAAAAEEFRAMEEWCGEDLWNTGQLVQRLRRRGVFPEGFDCTDDAPGYESFVEALSEASE